MKSYIYVQGQKKIVAAFRGMHVLPAKHSYVSVTDGQTDGRMDKVIPMCLYICRRHKN